VPQVHRNHFLDNCRWDTPRCSRSERFQGLQGETRVRKNQLDWILSFQNKCRWGTRCSPGRAGLQGVRKNQLDRALSFQYNCRWGTPRRSRSAGNQGKAMSKNHLVDNCRWDTPRSSRSAGLQCVKSKNPPRKSHLRILRCSRRPVLIQGKTVNKNPLADNCRWSTPRRSRSAGIQGEAQVRKNHLQHKGRWGTPRSSGSAGLQR
jgi:hypothetical protein